MGVIQSERFTLGCLIEWITLLDYRKKIDFILLFLPWRKRTVINKSK